MKYLPQMVISWETFSLYSLFCFGLGAAAGALAARRSVGRKKTENRDKRNMNRNKKNPGEKQLGGEQKTEQPAALTISALAESIWLRKKPTAFSGRVLSDSEDSGTQDFERPETEAFWKETVAPHASAFEKRGELCVMRKILTVLDREGMCSSVVSGDGRSTFGITSKRFSKVTLLSHSLRTARPHGGHIQLRSQGKGSLRKTHHSRARP